MIAIGYNHNGQPISIILAKNKEAAQAYWQGAGSLPYSERYIESAEPVEGTLINPLLKTVEINVVGGPIGTKTLKIIP